ncbi:MAG: ribonuclease E/G [Proteobacteria bacterium]|nr:ribonuclease E/G [Pseudomonadota bacterium]
MSIDTLVYEKKNNQARIAALASGEMRELEIVDFTTAGEGNIYLGRITRKIDLANGKTGYFLDIGDSREAFINAEENGMDELVATEGQSLVVQVTQEQRAEKGARLVRSLQFVGEYTVYCPYRMTIEVSNKIEDKLKAEEYRQTVLDNTTGQEGWIIRTSAVDAEVEKIREEMEFLRNEYEELLRKARQSKAPCLLRQKNNPLFDYINRNKAALRKVVVNNHNNEEEIKEKTGEEVLVEFSSSPFEDYGLEDAVLEALQKEVKLKSGGRITIEETKACVAIDVDSGGDKANGSLGRLNMEAAFEIAKQIKLRNLSGKIVIDFAGVSEYRYLKNVIEVLEQELQKDYVKSTIFGLSRGGNVEIVRMRRRPTLRDVLTEECASCQGTGRVEK